jgi:hypothetical protein
MTKVREHWSEFVTQHSALLKPEPGRRLVFTSSTFAVMPKEARTETSCKWVKHPRASSAETIVDEKLKLDSRIELRSAAFPFGTLSRNARS